MLDDTTVEYLRRHWNDGWNQGDLHTIMEPFAEDVVFSSPFVPRLTGDPAMTTIEGRDTIEGREALRSYVDHALRRTPGIRCAGRRASATPSSPAPTRSSSSTPATCPTARSSTGPTRCA